jgi:hypothetical protein
MPEQMVRMSPLGICALDRLPIKSDLDGTL